MSVSKTTVHIRMAAAVAVAALGLTVASEANAACFATGARAPLAGSTVRPAAFSSAAAAAEEREPAELRGRPTAKRKTPGTAGRLALG